MEKQEIIKELKKNHTAFLDYINELGEEQFLLSQAQKWTAGQQLQHIDLSVKPVLMAFQLPKFMLRWIFGKANRPGKSYEALVAKYHNKLNNGGRAPGRFVPKNILWEKKASLIDSLKNRINLLCAALESYTDKELDTLLLPHPLMGKLTLREMLYFTIYHFQHHLQQVKIKTESAR